MRRGSLEGDKISFAYTGYKRAIAEQKLREIPDEVVVWYDPAKASEAYLKKHSATMGVVIVVLGLVFSVGAALAVVARV